MGATVCSGLCISKGDAAREEERHGDSSETNHEAVRDEAVRDEAVRDEAVRDGPHQRLRELAVQGGEPMQAVLDKALEQYRRQKFLADCDAACSALQQHPEAWVGYQEELATWEVTSMDGLDPEEDRNEKGTAADAGGPHG